MSARPLLPLALVVLAFANLPACSSGGTDPSGRSGAARAERICCASQLGEGDGATARAGDLLLSNGQLRAVVQELTPSRWLIETKGGALTDIDILRSTGGPGGDFLKQVIPTIAHVDAIPFGLTANAQTPRTIEIVEAGGGSGRGVVRVVSDTSPFGWVPPMIPQGGDVQAELSTDYILERGAPYLKVVTTVRNRGRSLGSSSSPGDICLLAGAHEEFVPGLGFEFPGYAFRVEYLASVTPGASLLIFREGGPFPIVGDASGFLITLHPDVDLPKGGEVQFTRYFIPGNGDLASVQGPYYRLRGVPTGRLAGNLVETAGGPAAGALVSIFAEPGSGAEPGTLVSTALVDSAGEFAADLPPGRYIASVDDGGRAKDPGTPVEIVAGGTVRVALTAPAPGKLTVHVTDESGRVIPSRVGVDGTVGKTILVADRDVTEALRPGRYQATASRGFEWTRETREVEVPAAGEAQASFTLSRVVDTTGYIASEFHLHTNKSSDSNTLVARQVASIAGMGIEFAMATDHDNLTDYRPLIESLGLSSWLRSGVGEEVSTTFYGHFQGYPLTFNPDAAANGAVSWIGKTPTEMFDAIRADPANQVIQVNHPNTDVLGGYFEAIGYDNSTGEATRPPEKLGFPSGTQIADYDFDAFEAMNGGSLDKGQNTRAFATYASLTSFGRRYAMTGNSDSHSVASPAGYPRNLVRSSTDDPARVDPNELLASVKARRLVVSGGLFLTMTVDGKEVGSDVTDTDGVVDVGLRLQAPPWMAADRITLYANGQVVREIEVPATQQVVRYEGTLSVAIDKDTWFLATARGNTSMAPVVNDIPYAVTNPIWVDRDGNGRFDPPGVPNPRLAASPFPKTPVSSESAR